MKNWKNDKNLIMAALKDPDSNNPIAVEISKKIDQFSNNLIKQANKTGKIPNEILLHKPKNIFDEIVIKLTLQTIADELGQKITIHYINKKGKKQ